MLFRSGANNFSSRSASVEMYLCVPPSEASVSESLESPILDSQLSDSKTQPKAMSTARNIVRTADRGATPPGCTVASIRG